MTMTLAAATLLLLLATLLPLWRNPHWLVRGMDFPRLLLAVAAVLLLLAQGTLLALSAPLSWGLLAATAACLLWQFWWIAPYTPLWRKEVKSSCNDDPSVRLGIMTANVLATNRNAQPLLQLVQAYQPDVLVTLESDQWWQDQLDVLEPVMPHSLKCPLDNFYGMHVYSRLPMDGTSIEYLVEDGIPSMHAVVTLRSGDKVRLHFLHPAPPSPTENPESAERDAELVMVARSVVDSRLPVVVTGDLNDVAWSATTRLFRAISGLLDPRVGRGMFNTFHADYSFLRWPLDHLFHSEHFTLRTLRRLPPIGSDHFALFTELVFTPARGADQEGLDATREDHALARSITDAKQVSAADVPMPGKHAL